MLPRRLLAIVWMLLLAVSVSAGELPLLLAERYQGGIDISRYWVSEKLDGVRAYWDGKQLCFRSGNPVHAPDWFLAALPTPALDGELWIARDRFDQLSGIVRRVTPDDAEWRRVRYMIFELPEVSGDFTTRIERMKDLVAAMNVPWLGVVEQFRLPDDAALRRKLDAVVRGGGEGLMLHLADASYVSGRSPVLLKVTPWLDNEARVVAHLPGKGKHAGRLGALRVEMPNGRQFSIGSGFTDSQRGNPPPIGTLVTYRYRELTRNGIPRFPHFLRVRESF
jgi:DNA ligase 1